MLTRLIIVLAGAVAVLAAVLYARGGQSLPAHETSGKVLCLAADDNALLWIEKPSAESTGGALYALQKGTASPLCLHSEPTLRAITIAEGQVFAISGDGATKGAIVTIPRGGGGVTPLVGGLTLPAGLLVRGGVIYWTETSTDAAKHVHHIAATRPRTVIRAMPLGGGSPTTLVAIEGHADGFRGELLGVHDGRVYWLDRCGWLLHEGWSAVRSVPTEGGEPERVKLERSTRQHAVLDGDLLYYTAPSDDAGDPLDLRSVRRMNASGGESTTLTDWLPTRGRLVRHRGNTIYGAVGGAWTVPDQLAPPRKLTDGSLPTSALVAVMGGWLYEVSAVGPESTIHKTPLAVLTRLSAGLHAKRDES